MRDIELHLENTLTDKISAATASGSSNPINRTGAPGLASSRSYLPAVIKHQQTKTTGCKIITVTIRFRTFCTVVSMKIPQPTTKTTHSSERTAKGLNGPHGGSVKPRDHDIVWLERAPTQETRHHCANAVFHLRIQHEPEQQSQQKSITMMMIIIVVVVGGGGVVIR